MKRKKYKKEEGNKLKEEKEEKENKKKKKEKPEKRNSYLFTPNFTLITSYFYLLTLIQVL